MVGAADKHQSKTYGCSHQNETTHGSFATLDSKPGAASMLKEPGWCSSPRSMLQITSRLRCAANLPKSFSTEPIFLNLINPKPHCYQVQVHMEADMPKGLDPLSRKTCWASKPGVSTPPWERGGQDSRGIQLLLPQGYSAPLYSMTDAP